MCDACWQHVLADGPICLACVSFVRGKRSRAVSMAVAAVLIAGVLAFFASRHVPKDVAVGIAIGVAVGALVAILLAIHRWRSSSADGPPVRRRDEQDVVVAEPLAAGESPFRARLARVASGAIPRASALVTAMVIALSFVGTASLVPFALHLPRWERTEVVLAGWWLVGVTTLSALLFRGARLADDYAYRAPWDGLRGFGTSGGSRDKGSSGWTFADPSGCADGGEGFVIGLLLAAVALAAAWLVVELVAPLVFFLFYAIVVRAIGRVTRDNRGCERDFGRSMAWGTAWATLYLAPIAAAVWGLHVAMGVGGGR
jgi:hypothetical protein